MGRSVSRSKSAKRAGSEQNQKIGSSRSNEKRGSLKITLWISLALIAVNLIIYAPAWHYGFLSYDDPLYVSKNATVCRGLSWQNFLWAFTTGTAASWHPLTWLSHMLDVQLYGMVAEFHHLTNILLHIANTLLLFWALRRMTGSWRPSAVVAALFAVHPLHVESVAWIAERKDVLSSFFWMLTLHAYISYVRSPRLRRYLAILGVFALGLMAKSMLVTLPFVLLLLDIWPLRRIAPEAGEKRMWIRLVREKVPLIALSIASSIITFLVQLKGGTVLQLETFPLSLRVANAIVSYATYILNMLWPRGLAAYYPFEAISGWCVAGSMLGLAVVSIIAVRFARRFPWFLMGWLFYVITLAPVIGLIQVGGKSRADRFTYVPFIGIFIIAVWGIPKLLERWQNRDIVLGVATAVLICVLAIAARNQVHYWGNDFDLWEHTVQVTGSNYFARHNLGMAIAARGDLDGAIGQYVEALRINPDSAETHNALATVLLKQGRFGESLDECAQALRIKPDFADALSNRGTALAKQGYIDEAIAEFNKALKVSPDSAEIQYNLGFALANQGKTDEAIARLNEAIRINPSYSDAYNRLGNIYLVAEKNSEAMAQYNKALYFNPNFAEAHNNLGFALMQQNRDDEAIVHFNEAVRLNPDFAQAHNNLGLALMNKNQSDEAIFHFQEALRIQPNWTYAINNLGLALMDCRRNREAATCFAQVLRINPSDAKARKNLEIALSHRGRSAKPESPG